MTEMTCRTCANRQRWQCGGKIIQYCGNTFDYDIVGGGYFNDDSDVHLWTIQDAKDCDVLAGSKGEAILIFMGIGNTKWDDVIDYYCYYNCHREDFIVQENVEYWGHTENCQLKPATKEQRDTLIKAMTDAGYTFDFEKKELKKISQRMVSAEAKEALYDKPACSEAGEDIKEALRTEYEKGRADAFAEMQKEWSEDDEKRLQSCINILKAKSLMGKVDTANTMWLKSLKQRIGGKV